MEIEKQKHKLDAETIKTIIELFISWNGEDEPIDVANIDAAVEYIEEIFNTDCRNGKENTQLAT